jgi:hypothetical protein
MCNKNNNDIISSNNDINSILCFYVLRTAEANYRVSMKKQMKIEGNNREMLDNIYT